jgi:MoaA/NifB/PqqE/SkfB family radical SAM enzyme
MMQSNPANHQLEEAPSLRTPSLVIKSPANNRIMLRQLTLEITRKCPNRCMHCSSNSSPGAPDFLSFEEAIRLIHEGHALGTEKIIFSGGEPLVYPGVIDLVGEVSRLGMAAVVYTSGAVLDEKNAPTEVPPELVAALAERKMTCFHLTLASFDPQIHDRFMAAEGSWNRALTFIDLASREGILVEAHCPVTRLNCAEIGRLADLLLSKGVRTLRLLRLVPQGRAIHNFSVLELRDYEWLQVREQVREVRERFGDTFELVLGTHLEALAGQGSYECTIGSGKLLVEPDGTCAACPAMKGMSHALNSPNVRDFTLSQILGGQWQGEIAALKTTVTFGDCPAQAFYRNSQSILEPGTKN